MARLLDTLTAQMTFEIQQRQDRLKVIPVERHALDREERQLKKDIRVAQDLLSGSLHETRKPRLKKVVG